MLHIDGPVDLEIQSDAFAHGGFDPIDEDDISYSEGFRGKNTGVRVSGHVIAHHACNLPTHQSNEIDERNRRGMMKRSIEMREESRRKPEEDLW